jgi:hypothetical protein
MPRVRFYRARLERATLSSANPRGYEGDRTSSDLRPGYYLPDDAGYVEGAAASLPLDLQEIAEAAVLERYSLNEKGANGLTSIKEGGVAYTFAPGAGLLSDELKKALRGYKRYAA